MHTVSIKIYTEIQLSDTHKICPLRRPKVSMHTTQKGHLKKVKFHMVIS